jgi:hypothetical protein
VDLGAWGFSRCAIAGYPRATRLSDVLSADTLGALGVFAKNESHPVHPLDSGIDCPCITDLSKMKSVRFWTGVEEILGIGREVDF